MSHTKQCSGITPGLGTQESYCWLLALRTIQMLGIEPVLVVYKTNALPAILLLQPP